jgi:hypothetical protein
VDLPDGEFAMTEKGGCCVEGLQKVCGKYRETGVESKGAEIRLKLSPISNATKCFKIADFWVKMVLTNGGYLINI